MNSLKEKYNKEVAPALKEKFEYKNKLSVPRMKKAVINIGINQKQGDAAYLELVKNTLERITGQKPVENKARKSISSFKIREGMTVGMMVTLRGKRMYDFTEKLIKAALPRIRDFRGLDVSCVDQNGNINIGLREHIVFPEVDSDEVERIHGLQITIVSTTDNRGEGLELFRMLGFPIKKDKEK